MQNIIKKYFLLFLNINPMYNPENEKYKEIDQNKIILVELIEKHRMYNDENKILLELIEINPMYNPDKKYKEIDQTKIILVKLIEENDMYDHENEKYKEIDQTKITLLELIEKNKKIQCSSMIIKDELKALYQESIELDKIKMELILLAQTQKKCDSQLQEYDSQLQEYDSKLKEFLLKKEKIHFKIKTLNKKKEESDQEINIIINKMNKETLELENNIKNREIIISTEVIELHKELNKEMLETKKIYDSITEISEKITLFENK